MRRIVVDMQNALFTDAIAAALRNFDSDFEVFESELPQKTAELCGDVRADVLIAEVTSCTPWTFEDRMKTRSELKKICRRCKIVLTVDENNEKNNTNANNSKRSYSTPIFWLKIFFISRFSFVNVKK